MALIATPGATANSFADIAFADAYIATHDPLGKWAALTLDLREGLLQRATELLDGLNWAGDKSDVDNSLRWPRAYVYDKDDVMLSSTAIPLFLQRATAEFAFHLADGDTTREAGFKRIELGPLRLESGDPQLEDSDPIPKQIIRMVSYYLLPSGPTLVRG